jgi:hypothetical protein
MMRLLNFQLEASCLIYRSERKTGREVKHLFLQVCVKSKENVQFKSIKPPL